MPTPYKQIPTNARLFGEYLAGETRDITANDFTPEELAEIRNRVVMAKKRNAVEEAASRQELRSAQDYAKLHGASGVYDGGTQEEYLKERSDRVASYDNTRGKTSVGYSEKGEDRGVIDTIRDSFGSPGYNVDTTLGQFNAYDTPDGGLRVEDTYNWTKPEISNMDFAKQAAQNIFKPEKLGNLIARKFAPNNRERKANFTLPMRTK